ncbi:tyrosine kinase family catalytic domain protein [Rhizoctonia solani AG-3 Rhs1AP]|uniref:Tyrosine kinase family catalytic domain protein n=1 Tax=Rhizoctonia solani AG-3 Rhs1AP TaxID=1086054 RepID=X8J4M5_9AGAM|nr:tyrosine kinase family catalytic domain protein [Rhizoctonia solani AG-3 Rhs1AP]
MLPTAVTQITQGNTQILIKNDMPASEILGQIGQRVTDLTTQLDPHKCCKQPMESGKFGNIYSGMLCDGTRVALKCLRLELDQSAEGRRLVESFASELYIWSKCKHANVIELIGMATYLNQFVMVSPWMDNGNLKQFLHKSTYSLTERLQLCTQITSGVAYLQGKKIVHGDLKATNILMSDTNTPCIVDFGCSTIKDQSLAFRSSDLVSNGTIRWTAPEILLGVNKGKPSHEADIYSLGMTIFEVMTGSIPYNDTTEPIALTRILQGIVPERPVEYIPNGNKQADSLWLLLTNYCWLHEPKERVSAADLYHQIQNIHQGSRTSL